MNQDWFEMKDIRKKNFSKSVWIPLRASCMLIKEGKFGFEGYKEEFFGSGCIAVPTKNIEAAKKLGWEDIGISHEHSGYVDNGVYTPADIYKIYDGEFDGVHLVLNQISQYESPNVWHLNQDLVLTLGLIREDNTWVSPQDGYIEVARLILTDDKKPILLEIKSQYLKDYLCAREMSLYMTHFYMRDMIIDDPSSIDWENSSSKYENDNYGWEGNIIPIHEGGHHFGAKMAVFHIARTDVDESDDVPDISALPTNDNVRSESWERKFEGRKLYRVTGRLWRNEVIEPGIHSPKIRGDKIPSTVFFAMDVDGNKVCGSDLIDSGKWLWFKPEVIVALCRIRGSSLSFCSEQTGLVACSYGSRVHFGVNDIGYVNVYAKDIGLLPEWEQQIWAGYNVSPEGGVSAELLASQVRGEPANTLAPENFLLKAINEANKLSQAKLGIKIFIDHEAIPELLKQVHRFKAVDEASFYALAKDLTRLIVDSLDAKAMQSIVPPPKHSKWGSLKSLEKLLTVKYDRDIIRKITAPLVGVYELRHADAHLPSSKIEEAFKLINIDRSQPFVHQGLQMLNQVVSSIYNVAEVLEMWPN